MAVVVVAKALGEGTSGTEMAGATAGVVVAPYTVIVCVVVALLPYAPTVPLTVIACTPTSVTRGTHEKTPDVLILLFPNDVPAKLSLREKAEGTKLDAPTVNDVVVPIGTLAPGESSCIESVGPAPTVTACIAEALWPEESYT
jgi:hypothetical protein